MYPTRVYYECETWLALHVVWASFWRQFVSDTSLGSLSNYDGKKAVELDWQNNNFARASRFFVHFFALFARLRRETS